MGIGLVGILLAPHLGGQAQYSCQIEVIPQDPWEGQDITIRLFGTWPNNCVPNSYQRLILGNNIWITIFTPSGFCSPVLTPWSLNVPIGPLSAGTYQVAVSYPQGPGAAPVVICRGSFVVRPIFQRGPTQVEHIEAAFTRVFGDRLPAEMHPLLKGIEFTPMGKMLSDTGQTLALDETLLCMAYAATPGRMPVSAMLVPATPFPSGPEKGYIALLFLSGPSSFRHEGASIPPGLYLIKITKIAGGLFGELVRPGSPSIPIKGELLAEEGKAKWDLHAELYDGGGYIEVSTPWGTIRIDWKVS
ncbi:MAG: hypothetical protein ACUVQS_04735 [Candidatus Bipolaricaulaceae bacterium]